MIRRFGASLLPAMFVACSRLWQPQPEPQPEPAAQPEPQANAAAAPDWMPPPPAPRVLAPAALARSDSVQAEIVSPGAIHTYAWIAEGPWAIHVLALDRALCVTLAARKAGPPLDATATTSTLVGGAIGGVNADFFLLPLGTTVGPHVAGNEVLIGPSDRAAFGVDGPDLWIGRATVDGELEVAVTADSVAVIPVTQVNRPGDVALYTAWFGDVLPADSLGLRTAVRIRRVEGAGALGRGVVIGIDSTGAALSLDTGVVAITAGADTTSAALRRLEPGDSVRWQTHLSPRATEAVGGHIILIEDGEITEIVRAGGTEFMETRHPRTAVGFAEDGRRVWLVTVDGRQAPYSAGMSLLELAELMRDLGAEQALNLDGGGSTTMVVDGVVVNRPSDETGQRPVGNALVATEECVNGGWRSEAGGWRLEAGGGVAATDRRAGSSQ